MMRCHVQLVQGANLTTADGRRRRVWNRRESTIRGDEAEEDNMRCPDAQPIRLDEAHR
jgi:hypothetical protein